MPKIKNDTTNVQKYSILKSVTRYTIPAIDNRMLTNCKDLICVLKSCFEKKENIYATLVSITHIYLYFASREIKWGTVIL